MAIKLACAPCCWGVESAKNGNNPRWQTVLEEARQPGSPAFNWGLMVSCQLTVKCCRVR